MSALQLTTGQCATLACLLEVTAPKPGNVHRGADFDDVSFVDFVASAVAIGPVMERAATRGLGKTILDAVKATRSVVSTNTNLGTILLLAPLASVPRERALAEGVTDVLSRLGADDPRLVYEAIRLAQPGGLGQVSEMDVAHSPPDDLLPAMRLAADRDMVARQYVDHYCCVLEVVVPWIVGGRQSGWSLTQSIIHAHVRLLSRFPDSLIARKCGAEVAEKAAALAGQVLDAGEPGDDDYQRALADLDFWLRSDGNRRNPGTTADLIAAGLFAALREGLIQPPFR